MDHSPPQVAGVGFSTSILCGEHPERAFAELNFIIPAYGCSARYNYIHYCSSVNRSLLCAVGFGLGLHVSVARVVKFAVPPTMSWVSDKRKEISTGTSTIYGIPGPDSGHCGHGIETPRGENKKDSCMATAEHTSAHAIARLVGKMNATSCVIPPAPLFYRHLQMALSEALNINSQCYETQVSLSPYSREELKWWDNHMVKWNGKSLLSKEIDMIID